MSNNTRKTKKKCGVCNLEFEECDMTDVYMGMGSTQYVCEECDNESFFHVWKALTSDNSQVYIGGIPIEEIYNDRKLGSKEADS